MAAMISHPRGDNCRTRVHAYPKSGVVLLQSFHGLLRAAKLVRGERGQWVDTQWVNSQEQHLHVRRALDIVLCGARR